MKCNSFSLISDLHLDVFGVTELNNPDGCPVLVIAGDLCNKLYMKITKYEDWFIDISGKWEHILMIAGNHEWYDNWHSLGYVHQWVEEKLAEWGVTNVHFKHNYVFEHNNVAFILSTLWTDARRQPDGLPCPLVELDGKVGMNDFRYIRGINNPHLGGRQGKKWTLDEMCKVNAHSRNFLLAALTEHKEKSCVVVTHHAPFEQLMQYSPYKRSNIDYLYYNTQMEDFKYLEQIKAWCHGHTHCRYVAHKDVTGAVFPVYTNAREDKNTGLLTSTPLTIVV